MKPPKSGIKFELYSYCLAIVVSAASSMSLADIRFEEVTQKAGFEFTGLTAGASWGDFNGDGWPDIWVGNHNGLFGTNLPSLYVNQRDGTFMDVAKDVLSTRADADIHGGAWADFDNDGDQDLLVLAGGGGGLGSSPNYLFVNQDGTLRDEAARLNLDLPIGRGRTPLWFDADGDGRLDALISNRPRRDGKAPSAIYRQTTNGFEIDSEELNFRFDPPSGLEKIGYFVGNLFRFKLNNNPPGVFGSYEFAQLGDVSGDGALDLIAHLRPMRVYSLNSKSFEDITKKFGLGRIGNVWDAATEDFNGDGQFDMYLVRSSGSQQVVATNAYELRGFIRAARQGKAVTTVRFRTDGDVNIRHYTPNSDPTDPWGRSARVFIGSRQASPIILPFSLSPDDPWIGGTVASETLQGSGIWLDYDLPSQTWKLRSSVKYLNFIVTATNPIKGLEVSGFEQSVGERSDILLVQHDGSLRVQTLEGEAGGTNACRSVAAGDYDNDTDIDIYLVCSAPTHNLPNRLLSNDGNGNFEMVPDAGGAAGSDLGRGDVVATADFDRDGFLDLFITNGTGHPPFGEDGPHQLFRNRGNENHWLEIDLEGSASNRDGIGTRVELKSGGIVQVRVQNGGMHSFSQNHQRLHFGLGQNTQVDWIKIRWPSGQTQQLEQIRVDQILRIKEVSGAAS